MIPKTSALFAAASFLLLLSVSHVHACRYTVRDVGFVQFPGDLYHLYCIVGEQTPPDRIEAFDRAALIAFMDSNVRPEIIRVDSQPDHPALEYLPKGQNLQSPVCVLVAPDGRSLPIAEMSDSLAETMEQVCDSPVRRDILEHLVKSYCVVLFIEGQDTEANQQALQHIQRAIERITGLADQLPKPVEVNPHLVRISLESFPNERVLLWGMNLDEKALNDPQVAVLYGRGRRMGPVLRGEEIVESRLFPLLGLVGASCECGLDRSLIMGTPVPLRWDASMQSQVIELAGFDAENPMVKMEIGQILASGLSGESAGTASEDPFTDLLFGYSEQVVEFGTESAPVVDSPISAQAIDPPPSEKPEPGFYGRTVLWTIAAFGVVILVGIGIVVRRGFGPR
ncbi:MAG TPA: hypothetical protein PK395_12930 [bacterium]|nr:hypothetical protein [bacterium]HQQ00698.1 hypothetical protein [bacterium]